MLRHCATRNKCNKKTANTVFIVEGIERIGYNWALIRSITSKVKGMDNLVKVSILIVNDEKPIEKRERVSD